MDIEEEEVYPLLVTAILYLGISLSFSTLRPLGTPPA